MRMMAAFSGPHKQHQHLGPNSGQSGPGVFRFQPEKEENAHKPVLVTVLCTFSAALGEQPRPAGPASVLGTAGLNSLFCHSKTSAL